MKKLFTLGHCISTYISVVAIAILAPWIGTQAQTGPGGVGSQSTIPFWYDISSESAFANNDDVGTLTDISGNSSTMSQNTSSSQPNYISNVINGRPVLRFSGTNDFMTSGAISSLNSDASLSWYGVFDSDITSGQTILSSNYVGTSEFKYKWGMRVGSIASSFITQDNGTVLYQSGAYSAGFNIVSGHWNGSTDLSTYINNSLASNATPATSTISSAHQTTVLGRHSTLGAERFDGDIAEVFCFDFVLNSSQRNIVANYLAAKYGLTITNDKFAFGTTHENDLAGIGRESVSDNHLEAQSSIVRIRNADLLVDGDYLMWGHDDGALLGQTSDVPASYSTNNGERLTRVWRADEDATDVGDVTIVFNLNGISLGSDPTQYELLTDSDGTFSNATTESATPTVSGDSIVFSGVNLSDNTFFTIGNNGSATTCSALSTSEWNNVTWDCGPAPDSTRNAMITSGFNVSVSGTRTINDIDVDGTLTITGSGTLVVDGDFSVSSGGSVSVASGGRIIFRGTSAQTIVNSDTDPLVFGDLIINNSSGVTLTAGNEIHVSGGLTLTSGNLSCTQTLRMLSVSGAQAAIVSVGSGTISGSMLFDRFIDNRAASWATFSSPLTDCDFEQIDDDIFISGVTGGDGTAAGFVSLYFYDETTNSYSTVSNTTNSMSSGRGYELWLANDEFTWDAGIIDYMGTPSVAEQSISLNTTGGWNLIGNPYPAFLSWTSLSSGVSGITGDQYWIYDQATSQYVSRGDGTNVPPGQGFFVNSSVSSLTLTPSDDFASSSSSAFFKSSYTSDLSEIKLHLQSKEEHYAHSAYIRKDARAYSGYDETDMTMLRSPDSNSCEVAIEAGDVDLLVNYVPAYPENQSIPLKLTAGVAGEYSFKLDGISNFSEYQCVNLVNKESGEVTAIYGGEEIPVSLKEGEPAFFELVMSVYDNDDCLAPVSDQDAKEVVDVYANNNNIEILYKLDKNANAHVEVYDLLGNLILSADHNASFNRERMDMHGASSGMYMINIKFDNGFSIADKVYIP